MSLDTYSGGKENTFVERLKSRFDLAIDKDASEREARLCILKKVLNGTLYDNLLPWHQEYDGAGGNSSYIALARRKPCVTYNISKIIVDESTSMLFGDSHFPTARVKIDGEDDDDNTNLLKFLVDSCNLKSKMRNAAMKGSLGSVCVLVKVLQSKFYIDVLDTVHLKPVFDVEAPENLVKLTDKRKVDGATLQAYGYTIDEDDKNEDFYIVREWDDTWETYYLPYKVGIEKDNPTFKPKEDSKKSQMHNLGFVPAIWIKNTDDDQHIDGECTFESIIDIGVQIDYLLSQQARALTYSLDPTIVIKNPSSLSSKILIKGQPMVVGEDGDAFMLEMTGKSTEAVLDYVRALRELALEVVRGNRANPDKMSAIHSGKALQMLNSKLITFVEDLRLAYGQNGLKRVLCMMVDIINSAQVDLDLKDHQCTINDPMVEIELDWPEWYPPTPQDDLQESQALQTLVATGILSKESALMNVADKYHVLDTEKELTNISNEDKVAIENANKSQKAPQQPKPAVGRQKSKRVDREEK